MRIQPILPLTRGSRSPASSRARPWVVLLIAAVSWTSSPSTLEAQPAGSDYRIGPGDVLRIEVSDRPDVSDQYTVSAAGNITLKVVGIVTAAGKTATELASDLSRRFSLFGRDIPQVKVSVVEYRSRNVFVLGAVVLPGAYSFAELPSVWGAIAEAGGSAEDADLSAVELIRARATPGSHAEVIDVAGAIREARLESLPRLGPGDTVRVPRARGMKGPLGTVYIFGAIGRPGTLPVDQAADLVSAVILSGGPAPDADLSRVEIVRRSATSRVMRLRVDLAGYFGKAQTSGNPPLEAGDTIYVRHTGEGRSTLASAFRTLSPFLGLAGAVAALVGRR